jgi:serine/threonine protein kinase
MQFTKHELFIPNIINNKYLLLEQIGSGSFGILYKGENIRTKELVAIKIEPITPSREFSLLKKEAAIYQRFGNHKDGIPNVKWFGKDNYNYYMVFPLLRESLESVKQRIGIFSLKQVIHIGINILEILKKVHKYGYIHRDIKPDNFLLSMDNKQIFIIDFGLCKEYKRENKEKKSKNLIGTPCFASIHAHNFNELSRRDDLESLAYILFYFYFGDLPWKEERNIEIVKQQKTHFLQNVQNKYQLNQNKQLLTLIDFYRYVLVLNFEDIPNYNEIIDNFNNII